MADPIQLPAIGLPRSAWPLETTRDSRDGRRMAHNPEVAGSNPAPATKARWPFLEQRKGHLHEVCARILCTGARSSGPGLVYGDKRAANDQLRDPAPSRRPDSASSSIPRSRRT